eukprot:7541343-Ditylum_brightwellii.AAC.1
MCGINASVANYIDDNTPPHDLPSGTSLCQCFAALKHCHAAALEFDWNNLELGHNRKPHKGEKACVCVYGH